MISILVKHDVLCAQVSEASQRTRNIERSVLLPAFGQSPFASCPLAASCCLVCQCSCLHKSPPCPCLQPMPGQPQQMPHARHAASGGLASICHCTCYAAHAWAALAEVAGAHHCIWLTCLSLPLSLPAANAWAALADATGAHRCIWLTCLSLSALARFSITQFTHFGTATALVLLTEVFSAPICVLMDATVTALATHVSLPVSLPAALLSVLQAAYLWVTYKLSVPKLSCDCNDDSTGHP